MGADYSFYVKTIETHARTFFKVIIFSIGSVHGKKLMMPDAKLDEIVTKTKKKKDTDASLDLRICGIGPRYDIQISLHDHFLLFSV